MNNKKTHVQVVGYMLDGIISFLKENNVYVDSNIGSCNPLAMAGKNNSAYFRYCDDKKTSMVEVLNIRKNLSQMLSRDPDNFNSNYNQLPIGAEVRECNSADYFIFMNSAAAHSLFEKNSMVFSKIYPEDEFVKSITADKSYIVRSLPFADDFNWKYYYDQFIDTVLNEFDKDHIILIKSNSAQWYMEGQNIRLFENKSFEYKKSVEELDNYFIKRTGCKVIDEQYNHIPHYFVPNVFPYIIRSKKANYDIAMQIVDIIHNRNENTSDDLRYFIPNKFVSLLYQKIRKDCLKANETNIKFILENNLSIKEIESAKYNFMNEFFSDIVSLKKYLNVSDMQTLSNYAEELLANKLSFNIDYETVNLYTKYFKLDINDIIAFYIIYINCDKKYLLKTAAENILSNPDCLPINKAKNLSCENTAYLKKYLYLSDRFKGKDICQKIYISLENNSYIVFDLNSENFLSKVDFPEAKKFDYKTVINNNYTCPPEFADALTYSLEYYAEKARKGDGKKPTYLIFENENQFYESLKFIEYKPLLENENFVFSIGGENCKVLNQFMPIVDFTDIVDPNIALINVNSGLGDQICHFMLGQAISQLTNRKVVYFDLPYLKYVGGYTCDFKQLVKFPILTFSHILSQRLKNNYNDTSNIDLAFFQRINKYNFITSSQVYNRPYVQQEINKTLINVYMCNDKSKYLTSSLPFSYYLNLIRVEELKGLFSYNLSDYIEFQPFEENTDIELSSKMQSCDAVVIHVRLGDRAALNMNEDMDFFVEAIQKIMDLTQYSKKKFFVFSDDIKWCKEHKEKIGLDQVGKCEIIFIDGHSGEESFRDVQLMTLGKIIICGNSGFARIAAAYSDKWEMFFCANKITDDLFHKNVRKNKYETTPFLKSDYTISKPAPPPQSVNVTIKPLLGREFIEWLNFWFDNGNEQRDDRILLIGDSISRDYRSTLGILTHRPADFFAGSADIGDEAYWKCLDLFFSYSEYRQTKAHIQIGVNGINGVAKAVCSNDIASWEKNYEKLVNYILKRIPDLTIALTTSVCKQDNIRVIDDKINNEIIKRNQVAKKIAEKYKLPINDLYTLMFNEPHRDWVHFPKEGSEKIARQTAKVMKLI